MKPQSPTRWLGLFVFPNLVPNEPIQPHQKEDEESYSEGEELD
jgi:hypothetical protein